MSCDTIPPLPIDLPLDIPGCCESSSSSSSDSSSSSSSSASSSSSHDPTIYGLRTWNMILDPDTLDVLNATPNPSTATRVFIASDGTQYAWDATGRYVWWSTDRGLSWTAHDYGAGFCTNLYGRIVMKDGIETMMLGEYAGAGAVYAWATLAQPPVVTPFTAPIDGARPGDAYDGEPLLVGFSAVSHNPQSGAVARYVNGAWEVTILVEVIPGNIWGTGTAICKTDNGTYVAGFYSWYEQTIWVHVSTDFTAWGAKIDIVGGYGQGAAATTLIPGPNGAVIRPIQGPIYSTLRYSLDHGATWGEGIAAMQGPGWWGGTYGVYIPSLGKYYISTSSQIIYTSPDGINWTASSMIYPAPGEIANLPMITPPVSSSSSFSSSSSYPLSLVNPSLWVGAYDFADGVGNNLVTGAPAGPCNTTVDTPSVLASIISDGPSGFTKCVDLSPNTTPKLQRLFDVGSPWNPPDVNPTDGMAFAFWGKTINGESLFDMVFGFSNATAPRFDPLGSAVYDNSLSAHTFPGGSVEVLDDQWHHYTLVWSSNSITWSVYVDGVLIDWISTPGHPASEYSFRYFGMSGDSNDPSSNRGYVTGLCVIGEMISQAAITALAAGAMPDSAGHLYAPPPSSSSSSASSSSSSSASSSSSSNSSSSYPAPTNITSLATVSALTEYGGGYMATEAVDGNHGTRWSGYGASVEWFKFDFGPGNDKSASEIRIYRSNWDGGYTPEIQYSDDNSSWTTVFTGPTLPAGPANDALVTLTNPDTSAHRYWRISAPAVTTYPVSWNEVEVWYDPLAGSSSSSSNSSSSSSNSSSSSSVASADITADATVTASTFFNASFSPDKAVDGNMSTRWSGSDFSSTWFKFTFATEQAVREISLTRYEYDGGYTPVIEYSDDDANWTVAYTHSPLAAASGVVTVTMTNPSPTAHRYWRVNCDVPTSERVSWYETKIYAVTVSSSSSSASSSSSSDSSSSSSSASSSSSSASSSSSHVLTNFTSQATVSVTSGFDVPGYEASKAVDGNHATYFQSLIVDNEDGIRFDFGAGNEKVISEVRIYRNSADAAYYPLIVFSDDNVNWNEMIFSSLLSAGPPDDTLVVIPNNFSLPNKSLPHRYWLVRGLNPVGRLAWNEVELWG
jgi:hypothetical protein